MFPLAFFLFTNYISERYLRCKPQQNKVSQCFAQILAQYFISSYQRLNSTNFILIGLILKKKAVNFLSKYEHKI